MSVTEEPVPLANSSVINEAEGPVHVADAAFAKDVRIVVLYVNIIVGVTGGVMVLAWLWYNRRRKSRVNALILHVALSDMFVMLGALLPQLIWEIQSRHWTAGGVFCKILKLTQVFALFSSNYMVVVLSIDRHQAIRAPLREPFAVWKMTLLGWMCAFILSLPQLAVFHLNVVNATTSPFYNKTVCESIFRIKPPIYRQAYVIYADVTSFLVPLVIIAFCYIRIFLKIREKADESMSSKKLTLKPGKIHLQSTPSSSLPKAKIKTLKMTVVIVLTFILCGIPYHILELIYSFGDHENVSPVLASILGGMAPSNSATNPYVFLLFNANAKCMRGVLASLLPRCLLKRAGFYDDTMRSDYTLNRSDYSTVQSDVHSTRISKYNTDYSGAHHDHSGRKQATKCNSHMPDVLEMSSKDKCVRKSPATYPLIEEAECAFTEGSLEEKA